MWRVGVSRLDRVLFVYRFIKETCPGVSMFNHDCFVHDSITENIYFECWNAKLILVRFVNESIRKLIRFVNCYTQRIGGLGAGVPRLNRVRVVNKF